MPFCADHSKSFGSPWLRSPPYSSIATGRAAAAVEPTGHARALTWRRSVGIASCSSDPISTPTRQCVVFSTSSAIASSAWNQYCVGPSSSSSVTTGGRVANVHVSSISAADPSSRCSVPRARTWYCRPSSSDSEGENQARYGSIQIVSPRIAGVSSKRSASGSARIGLAKCTNGCAAVSTSPRAPTDFGPTAAIAFERGGSSVSIAGAVPAISTRPTIGARGTASRFDSADAPPQETATSGRTKASRIIGTMARQRPAAGVPRRSAVACGGAPVYASSWSSTLRGRFGSPKSSMLPPSALRRPAAEPIVFNSRACVSSSPRWMNSP
jgi:hypothetical protein